ncbi:MAG TPA: succinate dehydrogenase [Phycisphaerae bacterium]|nr:succinate dehydrogenase [Phycisphaerae bacterium]HRY70985.1 succinate dehydrogenase [Phycisphaerae bacterium]HSA29269.1 succinate dehydrogenase [Phycisphaerae bacterium]
MDTTKPQTPNLNEFLLRRLHSLTGVVPIGTFLVFHLCVNSMIVLSSGGTDRFQAAVNRIHALGVFLVPAEILFIFLPLAFHAALGVTIWRESKPNVHFYPFWCNWRYTLQRITGLIVLVFILVHLWHVHWLGEIVPGGAGAMFEPEQASATAAWAIQYHRWWSIPVYSIGIIASCYHFGTGLWTFLITWGITVGRQAQYRAGLVCAVIGTILGLIGLTAQMGMLAYPNAAPRQPAPATAMDAAWNQSGEVGQHVWRSNG